MKENRIELTLGKASKDQRWESKMHLTKSNVYFTLPGCGDVAMKNRLRVLRAERDWSQAELAERLSVSRQTVNAIETSRYDPSLPLAFKIAQLFGLPIEDIFNPDGDARGVGT